MSDVGGAFMAGIMGLILLCLALVCTATAYQDYVWKDFYDYTVNAIGYLIIVTLYVLAALCFMGAWVSLTDE